MRLLGGKRLNLSGVRAYGRAAYFFRGEPVRA